MKRVLFMGIMVCMAAGLTVEGAVGTIICVDPGHGGSDSGAIGVNNLVEKNLNLQMSRRLIHWLFRDTADNTMGSTLEWRIAFTRDSDVSVSLSNRASYANSIGAYDFISIHCNAYTDSSANGTESYCHPQADYEAFHMRDYMQDEMLKAWGLRNRGVKTATFTVLSNTTMPAVLLETGFVTSPIDAVQLGNQIARINMGKHLLYGLQRRYVGSWWKPARTPVTKISPNTTYYGICDDNNGSLYYYIDLSGLCSRVTFDTIGGTGNADLYVRYQAPPNDVFYDFATFTPDSTESLWVDHPSGGRWYIRIQAWDSYSNVALRVTYQ